jgi:hypothetical protein
MTEQSIAHSAIRDREVAPTGGAIGGRFDGAFGRPRRL